MPDVGHRDVCVRLQLHHQIARLLLWAVGDRGNRKNALVAPAGHVCVDRQHGNVGKQFVDSTPVDPAAESTAVGVVSANHRAVGVERVERERRIDGHDLLYGRSSRGGVDAVVERILQYAGQVMGHVDLIALQPFASQLVELIDRHQRGRGGECDHAHQIDEHDAREQAAVGSAQRLAEAHGAFSSEADAGASVNR